MRIERRGFTDRVTRRRFLYGAGTALALPWLDSLPAWATDTGKRVAPDHRTAPPTRFACLYFSNGVEPEHWWARGQGAAMAIGPGLQPLEPYRGDIVFLRGLYNAQAVAHKSAHLGRIPNLLSGAWVSTDQSEIRVGKTMDQVLAEQLGRQTPLPSLVVGIEPTELRLEDGLSMIYGSCISWMTETRPATKEIYPARVFDLLVGDAAARRVDRSLLDAIRDDTQTLRRELSNADQRKLDEYLESIRSIETRLDQASRENRLEGWRPVRNQPDMPRPADGLPQDVPGHMKLMLDLIVLAFQMDKTRIATCMLNNDLSQMNFGFLEGVQGSLHLDLTHNGRDPQLEAMYLKTNQFHVAQFAYLIDRLKRTTEGEGTLLDHALLLFCSNLFDGDKHQADEMPMVLAGRGGGLRTGRVLDYLARGDDQRRACSLYLSLMQRYGLSIGQFGDATHPLADL
ncbi:MAG: DUF1552 domain-containing protein [Pirellulaceae bacterium]